MEREEYEPYEGREEYGPSFSGREGEHAEVDGRYGHYGAGGLDEESDDDLPFSPSNTHEQNHSDRRYADRHYSARRHYANERPLDDRYAVERLIEERHLARARYNESSLRSSLRGRGGGGGGETGEERWRRGVEERAQLYMAHSRTGRDYAFLLRASEGGGEEEEEGEAAGPYDGLSAFATRLHGLRLLVYMSAQLLRADTFDEEVSPYVVQIR